AHSRRGKHAALGVFAGRHSRRVGTDDRAAMRGRQALRHGARSLRSGAKCRRYAPRRWHRRMEGSRISGGRGLTAARQGARGMVKWLWLAGAALALSACGGEPGEEQTSASLPAGETLRLAESEIAEMKAVGAEIATRDQAEALARIPGTLTSLSVRAGDTVRRGQRIGTIVDPRLGYETSAYGAQVAAAQAEAA